MPCVQGLRKQPKLDGVMIRCGLAIKMYFDFDNFFLVVHVWVEEEIVPLHLRVVQNPPPRPCDGEAITLRISADAHI